MIDKAINLFKETLTVPVIKVITEFTDSEVTASYDYESERYTRLYVSPAKRDFIYTNLSSDARDLLFLITQITNPDYEYTTIDYEKANEFIGKNNSRYSRRKFETVLRELIRFAILDCKVQKLGQYWYNPNYFCSGNRINMFPNNVKIVSTRVDSNVNRINN